jgi:hypothetical protein
MLNSVPFRLGIVALLSCAIAGCQQATVINGGSGYQFVRFSDPKAARAASQDRTAGPSIASNNAQCRKDQACRK